MRTITVRFPGECCKCGAELPLGEQAAHDRGVGLFCLPCAPTDPEEIREYRQVAADQKASRLEGWADKRQEKAAALHSRNEPFTGDYAFNTQPGHIPERARVNRRADKAFEHSKKAASMNAKASNLRNHVRVAGDAQRKRDAMEPGLEAMREQVRAWIKPGMRVDTRVYGVQEIAKVNRKTAAFVSHSSIGTADLKVDLSLIIKPA